MAEFKVTKELLVGLLEIGCTPDVEALFDLLVAEAPHLIDARECSIFWRDGAWREKYRQALDPPNAFYRRSTYEAKRYLIGIDRYLPGEGLTGWVAKHGRPLRIANIIDKEELLAIASDLSWADKQKGYYGSIDRAKQEAFLAVPVSLDQEIMGVIRIAKTNTEHGRFTQEDEDLLVAFADHVAGIIKRVERENLKSLWEKLYSSGIGFSYEKFSEYLQSVANDIPRHLGAKACSIFLVEWVGGSRKLKLRATTGGGALSEIVNQATYEFGEGLTGWVAKHVKSVCIKDVYDTDELARYGSDLIHEGKYREYQAEHSSFLACPIHMGDEVLGVIRIADYMYGGSSSAFDQQLLEYFCTNLAILVQNAYLFDSLNRDKERATARLAHTQQELQELGKLLKEDVAGIQKSLADILPETSESGTMKFGPVILENRKRDKSRVFIGLPFNENYLNVYQFGIQPALKEAGLSAWIATEQKNTIQIMTKIFSGIMESHIAIIDISEWNANVLFELGVLYGQNQPECHPVILIKRHDATVPADLAGMEYLPYGDYTALKDELVERLRCLVEKENILSLKAKIPD